MELRARISSDKSRDADASDDAYVPSVLVRPPSCVQRVVLSAAFRPGAQPIRGAALRIAPFRRGSHLMACRTRMLIPFRRDCGACCGAATWERMAERKPLGLQNRGLQVRVLPPL